LLLSLGLAVGSLGAFESVAEACGGCFQPPVVTEKSTVVTDHRMVLSVGNGKSTLYDQFRYQGRPEDFAWVLPIAGEVEVGISSDALFAGLDALTETAIVRPPQNCPTQPADCNGGGGVGCGSVTTATSFEDSTGNAAPTVTVTRQDVVGPYETVQIQSKDPGALAKWLADNGFAIPPEVRPVVDQYVAEHFNFLAVKLRPGQGVKAMRPVRVTSKGPTVVLPLRMVTAGVASSVGITLWTVAQGRYEPQNFPVFFVPTSEIGWSWAQGRSNYTDLRLEKAKAFDGRGFELESSIEIPTGVFPASQSSTGFPSSAPTSYENDYRLPPEVSGNKTPSELLQEDLAALFSDQFGTTSRVTRVRADLVKAALSEDLVLSASVDQSSISPTRTITGELDEPICPVWVGCEQNGSAPRSVAIQRSSNHCSSSGALVPGEAWAAASFGFVALAFARRRRSRVTLSR
jgi:hypothetical protein